MTEGRLIPPPTAPFIMKALVNRVGKSYAIRDPIKRAGRAHHGRREGLHQGQGVPLVGGTRCRDGNHRWQPRRNSASLQAMTRTRLRLKHGFSPVGKLTHVVYGLMLGDRQPRGIRRMINERGRVPSKLLIAATRQPGTGRWAIVRSPRLGAHCP